MTSFNPYRNAERAFLDVIKAAHVSKVLAVVSDDDINIEEGHFDVTSYVIHVLRPGDLAKLPYYPQRREYFAVLTGLSLEEVDELTLINDEDPTALEDDKLWTTLLLCHDRVAEWLERAIDDAYNVA